MDKMNGYHFKRFLDARGINPKEQRTQYKGIKLPVIDSAGDLKSAEELKAKKDVREEKKVKSNSTDKPIEKTNQKLEKNNTHNKKEIKTMKTTITNKKIRSSINKFLRTQGNDKGMLEVEKKGVVIPSEAIEKHLQQVKKLDLTKDVRVIDTDTGVGRFSLLKKTNQKLTRVAELAKKELPKIKVVEMEYEVETYRGEIPISFEMIEDADINLVELLSEYLGELDINTKNSEIITKMKTATAKTVTGITDIKTLFNKEITTMYNAKAYVSTSLFDELDKLKDESGRFLLQDDITVHSGKRINGKEVVVIEDEEIGTAKGDLVGFFGDLHEYITLFDRKRDIIQWMDDHLHVFKLMGSVRFDTAIADTDAGYYVTYTPQQA